jgi:hypothetical protein
VKNRKYSPAEDQIIRTHARTKTSKQIAKIIRTQLGIDRSHESIVDRRYRLVPDSQMEPIGYINLRDVDWYGTKHRHVRNQIRDRAEREGVIITYLSHGQHRRAVPLEWADAINAETQETRDTWLTREQLAKALRINLRQLRDYRYRGPYPALQAITTRKVAYTTYYHPQESQLAIAEFERIRERHAWIKRNWWSTKRAADHLGTSIKALSQAVHRNQNHQGVPVSVLRLEVGRENRRYYDPESVQEFKRRVLTLQENDPVTP